MLPHLAGMTRIAIVGEGVVGLSTAVAIQRRLPRTEITIFYDRDFQNSCSFGPAGLHRIDNINWELNRKYGKATFDWYAELCKELPGTTTGVKLLSGHIQSDDVESLKTQEKAFADIVYNFRWLTQEEIKHQFHEPSKHCIHFSSYAAEGNRYVPFLRSLLKNVKFQKQTVDSLNELGSDFDIVINCGGLAAGKLAGDDETITPIRGIVVQVKAPWHKHFLYRDFSTFTIPKEDVVAIGSVKQWGDNRSECDQSEIDEILERYYKLQPAMRGAPIVSTWCNLRPHRPAGIRLEAVQRTAKNGKSFTIVHHYGHGGAGFTLAWGTAQEAAQLVEQAVHRAKM